MAVINVPGPVSGRPYRVNIAGDAPTPEEQARIDQYVAQNEAPYLQLREQYFGAPAPVEEVPEDTGPDTSFRGALASAIDQPLENIATTSRMLGAEGIGDFLSGLTEAPENYESAITGFLNEDGGFYDFRYAPRALVEQAGQLGGSLLTRAAGAGLGGAAGSVVPGVGTAAGAAAGAVAGPFLFEALQLLGPIAQERALNNGRETPNQEDWLGAATSSAASGALNAIAPNLGGAVKRLIVEGGTEFIQSIIQQSGETALTDVGLDINLREAGAEGLLAGTTIGIIDAPGAIMRARGAKAREREQADEELTQDINEMIAEGSTRLQYADQIEAQLEGDQQVALSDPALIEGPREALALPAPRAEADPEQDISDTEFENLSFDRAQYNRVFQQVKSDTAENKPINIPAIQQRVKSDIPGTTVSQVRDIMKELQARGFVEENPAPGKNKYIAMGAIAPELKTPDVSYRRQIDTAAKFIKDDQTRLERLNYDLRSAEQFGRDLDGKKVTPNQVNQKIATIENRIKENQGRIDFANQRLQTLGQDTHVPRFEKVGVPNNVKAVPIPEGTVEALRPRFEAQKQTIKGLKEQLTSLNKQVRKLNEQAKKRQLSSNEFSRMESLRSQQADISKRLGEAEANLKSPEKIFQEAKGEQFREQERQRDIQKKLAAAKARAAADAVKAREDRGLPPQTPQFTAQQGKVFSALSKRLKNLGLKDIKLEGQQRIEGAEGFFDPTNKTISLAMGLYDPNMNDQQLFDAISEVMNHEVIHALRAIGVLKADEITTLENVAERTQYVKRTNEGVEKRKYTYLDRAKRLYPEYNPTEQKEEAIAEMFRDYVAGRLKLGGKPRNLFERIKDFFKSIIGVNRDAGFTAAEDIFEGIRRGEIGSRERSPILNTPTDQVVEFPNYDNVTSIKQSRIFAPERTVRAYKMFTLGPDGRLYPLFVDADTEVPVGQWIEANFPYSFEYKGTLYVPSRGAVDETGKPTKGTGVAKPVPDAETRQSLLDAGFKVSSPKAGAPHGEVLVVAARPGWHAGTLPKANHLGRTLQITDEQRKIMEAAGYGSSIKTRKGKNYLKLRHPEHVWAEVLYPDNSHGVDWQDRASKTKTKDINNELPLDGHYRYTQGAAGADETWVISGNMFVNRILSPQEVDALNAQGSDIPDNPRIDQVAALLGEDAAEAARRSLSQGRRYSRLPTSETLPELPMAPEGTRAHKLPYQLLMSGTGEPPRVRITQKYTPGNAAANNAAIQQILDEHPDALTSVEGWARAMQAALGGDFIPAPPMVAINYAASPEAMAEKLRQLTPELRKGVDKGFEYVEQIRDIYQSGNADPRMTLDLFVWGILSRGAGPVQQEGGFIDIIDNARPFIKKAINQPLTEDDLDIWLTTVSKRIPEGSPGRQVTDNVNAAGKLLRALSQFMPNSDRTVIDVIHEQLSNPNASAADVRQTFLSNTEGSGIDNKVVSFILLVGGKDDVLVMDRIQGRHMWDDGRFGGANIYDGIGPQKEGLTGIFRGPVGILNTRILEDGMRRNVQAAYDMVGRPDDASLGRWHWETWVIEGEQVVSHDTLAAVINRSAVGTSVTEGKTDTFSSGMTYRRGEVAPVVEYPLSNENTVYMKPERFKEFTGVLAKDATRAKSQTGVFTEGKFKVTERADIPWFERPEVDRTALDALAMEYENARPDGSVLVGTQRAREGQDASQRGNSDLDRRYSRIPAADQFTRNDTAGTSRILERRVPFRGLIAEPVRQYGTPDRPVYEIEDPQVFTQMIKRAKADLGKLGAQVTDYTEMGDSYEGKRLFLFDGGYSGFALNGDDIVSVFSVPGPAPRGAVKMIMPIATAQGGRRLDAFDTFLPKLYAANGFRAVARLPFNREFAPEGWDFDFYAESFPQSNGEPDVVFMVYDPADASENTSNVIDDYDRGGELQEEAILELQREKRDSQASTQGGKMYSRLLSTTALNQQVQEKKLNLSYARSSDFIAKLLGVFIPKDRAQIAADGILRRFQDNMLPVGRMIQELQQKGLSITDAMDTYLREELYHGVVGAEITARENTIYKNAVDAVKKLNVSANMMDALQRVSDSASGKTDGFVKQARETSGSDRLALADTYLYARHAKERNAFMRRIDPENQSGSGMTDREADAILNWFNSLDPQNRAAIADLDTAVRAIVADTNNTRVQSGMLPEDFDTIVDEDGEEIPRPQYQYYVPLRGFFDPTAAESDGVISGGGSRFGGRGRPDPQALGRYQYATNILGTTIDQNQRSVDRGERNKVGQSFLNLLRASPEMTSSYARILDLPPQRRAKVGGRVRMITDFRAAQDPNIFVVKENGKDVYVEIFDNRIAKALKGTSGTGSEAAGWTVRSLGAINRYLSNINTSYNPEFFITNLFRDLQTAGVNIQQFEGDGLVNQIRKDIRKSLVGIKKAIIDKDDSSEWSQIYKDFVAAGGQNSLNQMSTAADQMNNIRNLLGDIADQGARGKWNQVKNSFVGKKAGSLLSTIENYNTVIENGIRVVTYKALLDRGFSRERAAQAARNVTVNFAKGGEYKTLMNAYSLFYNASIQGSFAMLNAALRSKKVARIWAGVVAAGILQDQLNALLSEEDDDETLQYDKIPDYILEHNLILPDPFGFTDRSYIAIPMPYGLNMAHNMGRAMSRAGRGQYDAGEAASTIVGTIANTISPMGDIWNEEGLNLPNFVAPTVADPFIDVIQNQDYAGRPVYKDAFPGDRSPDSQRYWSTTNPSAVWVAQTLNELTGGTDARSGLIDLSPDVLNFWLDFGTGGVGRFVQRTAEAPMRFYTEGMTEEIYREVPFVRKIIGSVSEREDYGRYIEKRDSILLAGDELRAAIDNRDPERARSAREQFAEELRLLPRVRVVDNAIRNVNRRMNSVRDANIPDERKQQLLDALDERKQALIARGNQLLADYR